jgi:hypothetical protein
VLNSQAADALLGGRVRVQLGARARQTLKSGGLVLAVCATAAITTTILNHHPPAEGRQPASPPVRVAPPRRYRRLSTAGQTHASRPQQHRRFEVSQRAHPPTPPKPHTEGASPTNEPGGAPESSIPVSAPPSSGLAAGSEEQTKGGPFSP